MYIPNKAAIDSYHQKVHQLAEEPELTRNIRSICDDAGVITLINNPELAITFLIICVVLLLLLLGVIKGLLGLYCCPPVGMCGLGALIDLPRPLCYYQEPELQEFEVKYDIIGWPVHPQTGKRTVRAISLRTEFCLNVIFFLTYPVVMTITLLSLCCFANVYDTDDSFKEYKDTHTIMLTDCPSFMMNKNATTTSYRCATRAQKTSVYDVDPVEEEYDTRYVLEQMIKSEASLKRNRH